MKRSLQTSIGFTSGLLLGLMSHSSGAANAAEVKTTARPKPNIIVIMADDMGYSDIGCYGGEISTPNLDNLARGGVRFTQFYNTARCCPTRAALLTGLYSHQAGVGHMTTPQHRANGEPLPGYSGRLNERCVTIAETLKGAGYFTAMAGKWHVGQNLGATPWGRGFDRSLNAAAGGFYFADSPRANLFLDGQNLNRNDKPLPESWYSTDLWTDYSLKFIDEARAQKKPFFLYLAHNAPHFPLQAPPQDIARWRGKFKSGWDKLRQARYQRQIKMGIVDKAWPLSPRLGQVPAWDKLTPAQRDRYDHMMAIYAAVVEHMDSSIGRLVSGLRQRGELDNTLIMFLSDNGGNAEAGVPGTLKGDSPGDAKSDVFVGQCWATLNNTPFVRYKHYTHEGGIATPLIAHWPAGIAPKRSGRLESQPGHVIDIMATCVDVAGAPYPQQFNGHTITPLEGTSLRPAFAGQPLARAQPLFWEHEGNRAVRDGRWKMVALEHAPWELYDLQSDRTEQRNLAAAHPQIVQALAAKWDAWAARANVLPLGGWRGAPARKKKGKNQQAEILNTTTRFTLKSGDALSRDEAPAVVARGFTITATFAANAPGGALNGVILAQGGSSQGYALYMENGKLVFALRRLGTLHSIAGTSSIAPGAARHTAVARLDANGAMSLDLDGHLIAQGKAPGPLTALPLDGLQIGLDENGLVGPYTSPNPFSGTIESVVVDLQGTQ